MADAVITPANVAAIANSTQTKPGIAGATIVAGKAVYLDAVTSKWKLAQNDGTVAEAAVKGIAMNGASDGQPIDVATGGNINPGATLIVGIWYGLSAAAGGICPTSDHNIAQRHSLIGYAPAANVLELHCLPASVAAAAGVTG